MAETKLKIKILARLLISCSTIRSEVTQEPSQRCMNTGQHPVTTACVPCRTFIIWPFSSISIWSLTQVIVESYHPI